MKGFKGKRQISEAIGRARNAFGKLLSGTGLLSGVRFRGVQFHKHAWQWIRRHKLRLIGAAGAVGMTAAITMTGYQYVKTNTFEVYHVFVGAKEAGVVSSPDVVRQFLNDQYAELKRQYPDLHMVLNTGDITYQAEKGFKPFYDDEEALANLKGFLSYHAVGVEVWVDGELIGVVKDRETADRILEQVKSAYAFGKKAREVTILSAQDEGEEDDAEGKPQERVEEVGFVEEVDLKPVDADPKAISSEEEVLARLTETEVRGIQYVVQPGDCVTCIAEKLNLSTEYIYEKNPEVKDAILQIGQVLDLTEEIPKLSVRTVLTREEVHDVQFQTVYEKDDTMKMGTSKVVQEGKPGKKKVTYRVEQINGVDRELEILAEEVLVEPVPRIVRQGTKIVPGQGTGALAWPVTSNVRITSGYGKRGNSTHKGVDLVASNKNILAADNGTVVFAGTKSGYGKCVIIDHGNGLRTLYAHLSSISVTQGTVVQKGEKIGVMGSTGDSTGVHLHFEVLKNGVAQNPMNYLGK